MEIMIGILALIATIVIAFIPYIRSKFILRPELTIEIISNGGSSSPKGLARNNDFSKGYVDSDTAIRIIELTWNYKLVISNNSDLIAFYPEIECNPKGPKFTRLDKLNKLQPIKPAESVTLQAEYRKVEETLIANRTQIGQAPPIELKDLGLLLSYENKMKRRFYTIINFNSSDDKYKFLRHKPENYKNN